MAAVASLGAQVVEKRHRLRQAPAALALRHWRTNLTGLSHSSNLYLVAHAAHVAVYEPSFPHQSISSEAVLLLSTPPTAPNLRGYIDRHDPHTINNLIVQYLGTEEIIAVVRDDGDVDAYLIRHVVEAIKQRRSVGNALGLQATELRPTLHQNVGNSAWGLAIHTVARLIAVSSNNHEVNVFAFALVDGDRQDSTNSSSHLAPDRTRDEHMRFTNGTANVPHISFCNTGHDAEAKWLLSTDVSGLVRVWDLHNRESPQCLYVGRGPRYVDDFSRLSGGWTVSFLDPRAFKEADEAVAELPLIGSEGNSRVGVPVWDFSDAASKLYDAQSTLHISNQQRAMSNADSGMFDDDDGEVSVSDDEDMNRFGVASRLPGVSLQVGEAIRHFPDDNPSTIDSSDEDGSQSSEETEDVILPTMVEVLEAGPPASGRSRRQSNGRTRSHVGGNEQPDFTSHQILAEHRHDASYFPLSIHLDADTALCPALPCPIFLTSVSDMYLLQPSTTNASSSADHFPLMLYGQHFRQHATTSVYLAMQNNHDIEMFDRCSLFAQIPSLGVVVVGNQKGRVAVYSCHKTKARTEFALGKKGKVKAVKWVHGLKLEALLPFASQERVGLRPLEQLYGIAVAPMQGCQTEDAGGSLAEKRWRLLMMYIDETILSYEIKRRGADKVSLDLDGMV